MHRERMLAGMNTGFCGKSFDGEKCVFCIIKRGLLLPLLLLGLLTAFSPSQKTAETTWREQYDLGVRYLSEGNYEEAIIAFTAAIEIDPKQAPAYLGRGDAYIGSGETGENLTAAQADYEQAIVLDETSADTYEKLANVYVSLGDIESAIKILQQGSDALGDDTLFQARIDELTAEVESSSELASEPTSQDPSGPRVERTDFDGGIHWLDYYDETGTLTRGEIYNPDGTMCTSTLYYYDEAGELSREEIYSSDGTLSEIGYCYYDTAGNLTQEEYFSPDGTMCSYRLAYFDEAENVVQNDWYDPDGTLRNSLKYN